MSEWDDRVAAAKADLEFMGWVLQEDSDILKEYSSSGGLVGLVGMHNAWTASRKKRQPEMNHDFIIALVIALDHEAANICYDYPTTRLIRGLAAALAVANNKIAAKEGI